MANYSGIYKHYEGTDANCSGTQQLRELTWATDIGSSGAARYLDCNGDVHYLYPGPDTNTGENNTASNLGSGSGLYSTKVGVDLRFKSIAAGSNITVSDDGSTITISSTGGGGGTLSGTLTSGYLPMAISSTELADSHIRKNFRNEIEINANNGSGLIVSGMGLHTGVQVRSPFNPFFQLVASGDVVGTLDWDYSDTQQLQLRGSDDATILSWEHVYSGLILNSTLYIDRAGDVYSEAAWTNYGSTSAISGWADFDTDDDGRPGARDIKYKVVGKTVFVNVAIAGSGNNDPTRFTLPYPASEGTVFAMGHAGDHDGSTHSPIAGPIIHIASGESTISMYRQTDGIDPTSNWGLQYGNGSGHKWLCGTFVYQRQ